MADKVKVAIYNNDLRISSINEYEISQDGTQIKIVPDGAGTWKPEFTSTTYLEQPRRKWYPPFHKYWERVYFVPRKGAKCVDFATGTATGPKQEDLDNAITSVGLKNLGQDEQKTSPILYLVAFLDIIMMLILIQIVGVFT